MKAHSFLLGCLIVCQTAAMAAPGLPAAAPGPFAPVPAKLTNGPDVPATPMEPKAPDLATCKNAAAVLRNLRVRLTNGQKALLDKQRFLLLPIECTALAEALPKSDDDR